MSGTENFPNIKSKAKSIKKFNNESYFIFIIKLLLL